MIKVYFESNGHAEQVAIVNDEETYAAILPALEKLATIHRMIVTEIVREYPPPDKLEIATWYKVQLPEISKWFYDNVEPTYLDTYLNEHLFSVDVLDNVRDTYADDNLPEFIIDFLIHIPIISSDITYIRFI